jgi:hypothetical protein
MTPKEKALLLIRRFYSIGAIECKQCALIAVDELGKFLIDSESEDFNLPDEFSIQYWQEVKQEIEKL